MQEWKDENEHPTVFEWDANGNLLTHTNARNAKKRFAKTSVGVDFTSAEQAARRLLKHAPQGLEGKLALAYVHLHGAEHDEAESLYQDVLERDPTNPTALNNLGNILYMRRDFEGAGRLFDQILSNEAAGVVSRSIALSNLAELYQIEGDTDSDALGE